MKYHSSDKILYDPIYIKECINLYEKLRDKMTEEVEKKNPYGLYEKYYFELNPDIQMCIDTIWMLSGWFMNEAFSGFKGYQKNEEVAQYATHIRAIITDLASFIASKSLKNNNL